MKSFGCADLNFMKWNLLAKPKKAKKSIVGLEKSYEAQMDFLNKSYYR